MRDAYCMKQVRVTISIARGVYTCARRLSAETGRAAVGEIISGLARSGMAAFRAATTRNGLRLLPIGESATSATLEDVNPLSNGLW